MATVGAIRVDPGVLFQLMEYHESFGDVWPTDRYVGGEALGESDG